MKKVFNYLGLLIAFTWGLQIQAQEVHCIAAEENDDLYIPDAALFNTIYSSSSCSGTSDPGFLSSSLGSKNNYIPYPNNLHAQNVKKKIKIKVFVLDSITNLDEYTPAY